MPRDFHTFSLPDDPWSAAELRLFRQVESDLAAGLALRAWWQGSRSSLESRFFDLIPNFRGYGQAHGFTAEAHLPGLGNVPVMGAVQRIFFTRPKVRPGHSQNAAQWINIQIRRFALRYFLRVFSYARAQVYPILGSPPLPRYLQLLSWYPPQGLDLWGIDLLQTYYKRRDGRYGRFPKHHQSQVLDLQELRQDYRWILVEMVMRDTALTFSLAGPRSPRIVWPLTRHVYAVLCPELIADAESTMPGLLGCFGPGCTFVEKPNHPGGVLTPAFETFRFVVNDEGEVHVEAVFVFRQPRPIEDPTDSLGPWEQARTDPTATGQLDLAGLEQIRHQPFGHSSLLDRAFLLRHTVAQYYALLGALRTWNEIPDWLDEAALPAWVVTGRAGAGIPLEAI